MVENRTELFTTSYQRIILCQHEHLSHRQSDTVDRLLKSFPNLEVVSGLPNVTKLKLDLDSSIPSLLIIDDLQSDFLNSQDMFNLLTVDCHHLNISVIYTMQNFFAPSKFGKTLSRNAHIKVFFYNRADLAELRHISIQITPQNSNFLQSCFDFLIQTFPGKFHYILVDSHFRSSVPQFMVRSCIFPKETTKEIEPIIFFSTN